MYSKFPNHSIQFPFTIGSFPENIISINWNSHGILKYVDPVSWCHLGRCLYDIDIWESQTTWRLLQHTFSEFDRYVLPFWHVKRNYSLQINYSLIYLIFWLFMSLRVCWYMPSHVFNDCWGLPSNDVDACLTPPLKSAKQAFHQTSGHYCVLYQPAVVSSQNLLACFLSESRNPDNLLMNLPLQCRDERNDSFTCNKSKTIFNSWDKI